ncbi:MAG: twin-arginine translocation signal domain-containing protein [Ekhidna sp.]
MAINQPTRRDFLQGLAALGLTAATAKVFNADEAHAQQIQQISQLGHADGGHLSPRKALEESRKQLVLHYGNNIKDTDIIATLLREDGIPATAFSGGPTDKVFALLNERVIAKYNQESLNAIASADLGEKYKNITVTSVEHFPTDPS